MSSEITNESDELGVTFYQQTRLNRIDIKPASIEDLDQLGSNSKYLSAEDSNIYKMEFPQPRSSIEIFWLYVIVGVVVVIGSMVGIDAIFYFIMSRTGLFVLIPVLVGFFITSLKADYEQMKNQYIFVDLVNDQILVENTWQSIEGVTSVNIDRENTPLTDIWYSYKYSFYLSSTENIKIYILYSNNAEEQRLEQTAQKLAKLMNIEYKYKLIEK